jgi:hypothetical protein
VRIAANSSIGLALCALAATAPATPAAAAPVAYTLRATLQLIVGTDDFELAGATLVMVATADTDDLPTETVIDLAGVTARYAPNSVSAVFSNRPGGAPDAMTTFPGLPLRASNTFASSSLSDVLGLEGGGGTFEGTEVFFGGFTAFFLDQELFPGTGVPPLPLFAPGDVGQVLVGVFEKTDRFPAYRLTDATFTAVPEPGSAVGVALGLVGLGLAGRRRAQLRAGGVLTAD